MARGRPAKKQIILDAAQDLFAQYGYQGTAIDLVVRAAGVSKPTVYNNFPSKLALLQSLIIAQLTITAERHQRLIASTAPPLDKLQTLFKQIIEHPFELGLYRIYYGEPYKLNDETMSLLKQMDRANLNSVQQTLQALSNSELEIESIASMYKNNVISSALTGTKTPDISELKRQLQVLGLVNFNS